MNTLKDESGQISAEMVLLFGAIIMIVIIAGVFLRYDVLDPVTNHTNTAITTARDNAINRM